MGRLATVGRVVEQTLRRLKFAPVDKDWPAEAPDHQAFIRADYSMCCSWHEEQSFLVSQPRRFELPLSWLRGKR
jgi:hypothetical protein